MKSFLILCILIISFSLTMGQNIGLRINKEFSNTKEINNSLGFGLFICFDDSAPKFNVITYFDFIAKNQSYSTPYLEELNIFYARGVVGASGLFLKQINNNIIVKYGPDINHSWVSFFRQNKFSNSEINSKASFLGLGLTFNLNLHRIFKLPLNFDIFISPNYLINVKDRGIIEWTSNYNNNLMILNIQLGLSFILTN